MTTQTNSIAIKERLVWFSLWAIIVIGLFQASYAYAQEYVATVVDLSGPLLARKANGVVKVLAQKSTIDQGDLLESEKNTYARIKFTDNSEVTIRPNTQLKIDAFSYDSGKPENDSSVLSLFKGGLRSVTGLLGKRSKEKYKLTTPAATIGIRGTTFIAEYLPATNQAVALYLATSYAKIDTSTRTDISGDSLPMQFLPWPRDQQANLLAKNEGGDTPAGRNSGLYVQVLDGTIFVTNAGGTQDFTAGQFGYVANFNQPPVVLSQDPGMDFLLPISFSLSVDADGKQRNVHPEDLECLVK